MVGTDGMQGHGVGGGTWMEQARRVRLLAAELDVVLDEQALIVCDVRDLLALGRRLQEDLRAAARRPWMGRRDTAVGWAPSWSGIMDRLPESTARWLRRQV